MLKTINSSFLTIVFSTVLAIPFANAQQSCRIFFKDDLKVYGAAKPLDLGSKVRQAIPVDQSPLRDVANRMTAMRGEILNKVGAKVDRSTRETNIKIMESWLRSESFLNAKKLLSEKDMAEYDAVVVGTGPHALFALASLLKENPNARVLVLAKDDTAGATFREGYSFIINSSSRPSGVDKPLPGLGNINELPNLPIQVPEMTSLRYPEAADLGDALVANAYAVFKSYKNVDLIFDSEIPKAEFDRLAKATENEDSQFKIKIADPMNPLNAREKMISSQYVITATGLGAPKSLDGFFPSTNDKQKLRQLKKNGLAGVVTFEEFMRLMADSENPWAILKDLKIALVGDGNSADVTAEFLLGLSAPAAYGSGVTQGRSLQQISWIGQKLETCLAFITSKGARIRYAGIGSGLKSSDENVAPAIKASPPKLRSLSENMASRNVKVTLEDGSVQVADLVIVTTGFEGFVADAMKSLQFLEKPTTVSNGAATRIGMTSPNGRLIVTGPSVRLPVESDLKGVIQNFVSIFNNAPRSAATGKYVAQNLRPNNARAAGDLLPVVKNSNKELRYAVNLEGLEKFTDRDFTTNPYFGRINNFNLDTYIKTSFHDVLSKLNFDGFNNGKIKLTFVRNQKGFDIFTDGFESPELVAMLAYNRDFFSPLLSTMPKLGEAIQISIAINQGKMQTKDTRVSSVVVDKSELMTRSENAFSFVSRIPGYIRSLFSDQSAPKAGTDAKAGGAAEAISNTERRSGLIADISSLRSPVLTSEFKVSSISVIEAVGNFEIAGLIFNGKPTANIRVNSDTRRVELKSEPTEGAANLKVIFEEVEYYLDIDQVKQAVRSSYFRFGKFQSGSFNFETQRLQDSDTPRLDSGSKTEKVINPTKIDNLSKGIPDEAAKLIDAIPEIDEVKMIDIANGASNVYNLKFNGGDILFNIVGASKNGNGEFNISILNGTFKAKKLTTNGGKLIAAKTDDFRTSLYVEFRDIKEAILNALEGLTPEQRNQQIEQSNKQILKNNEAQIKKLSQNQAAVQQVAKTELYPFVNDIAELSLLTFRYEGDTRILKFNLYGQEVLFIAYAERGLVTIRLLEGAAQYVPISRTGTIGVAFQLGFSGYLTPEQIVTALFGKDVPNNSNLTELIKKNNQRAVEGFENLVYGAPNPK